MNHVDNMTITLETLLQFFISVNSMNGTQMTRNLQNPKMEHCVFLLALLIVIYVN